MGILSEIFCWWGGNTWGTRLWTWRQGRYVGGDELGNRYYEQR
jgi:NADH:ubiquinone oxidoreductase subunit